MMYQRPSSLLIYAAVVVQISLLGCGCSSGTDAGDRSDVEVRERNDMGPEDSPGGDVREGLDSEQAGDLVQEIESPCLNEVSPRNLSAEADPSFGMGPYLMSPAVDGVTVLWHTSEPEEGSVAYGEVDTLELTAGHEDPRLIHEVRLTGLEPDHEYAYQVSSGEVSSAVHRFRTPPVGQGGLRFVAWGDSQSIFVTFAALVERMVGYGPHLALGLGDMVQTGQDVWRWKMELFDPARTLLAQVPFAPAMGNHEGNAQYYYDYFANPNPYPDPEHESYYSFTWGNGFFLVIDTNKLPCPLGEVDTPQSTWIREQVASPEALAATWRIALGHESGYSESWSPGDCDYDGTPCIRNWLLPLLDESGFHFYLAGHTHDYERGQVGNLIQIIAGGGGGSLDQWCTDLPQTSVVYQNHHFLVGDLGCTRLKLSAVDQDGRVFDWVELDKDQPGQPVDQGPAENLPELKVNEDAR